MRWRILRQVQGEAAVAGFQLTGAAAGGVGVVAQLARAMDAFDGFGGDAVVEGIDHAADGAAVEQGGRATDDLNALDIDRVRGTAWS